MQKHSLSSISTWGNRSDRLQLEKLRKAFGEVIAEALTRGEKVTITGFGTFYMKKTKAKVRRHPATGELITIPPKAEPQFKPCKEIVQAVSKQKKKP